MGHFGRFGGTKNGTWGALIKILRPLLDYLDTLGTILDPGKVIFGHFIFLVIFPLKFPLKPKKFRTLISLGQNAQLLHICFQETKCNQEI